MSEAQWLGAGAGWFLLLGLMDMFPWLFWVWLVYSHALAAYAYFTYGP